MSDVSELARAARETPVIVIGGGIAGLVAAYECARVGMPVTLLEQSADLGGSVRDVTIDDVVIPSGAIGYAQDGAVAQLVEMLQADLQEFAPQTVARAAGATMTTTAHGLKPLPQNVLGIPGNPFAKDAVGIIGWGGAWRAYLDRLRPPLTIGHEDNLDKLVRARMGRKVAERLVAPVARAQFGASPTDVDVAVAAPELNPALTRLGSLTGAVSELLLTERPQRVTLAGGMTSLVSALAERIGELGGTIVRGATATEIVEGPESVLVRSTLAVADDDDNDASAREDTGSVVIVATPEHAARSLLASHVCLPKRTRAADSAVLTVTMQVPNTAHSWGLGVAPQPSESAIESIDDLTAQWGICTSERSRILRARVRVTGAENSAAEIEATVLADTARLLATTVEVSHLSVFAAPPHAEVSGQEQASAAIGAARSGRVIPVGAWVSGTGLDRVVSDTQAAIESVRKRALFRNRA